MSEQSGKNPPTWLDKMNDRYAFVLEGGDTRVFEQASDPDLGHVRVNVIKPSAFKQLHDNQLVDIAPPKSKKAKLVAKGTYWIKHPRRRTYENGTTLRSCGDAPKGYYNLWLGWGVEPKPGSWSKMKLHLLQIVCGGSESSFNYLMGWMARAVQMPEKQGEVAVVLRGEKGTGKGTLGNALVKLFGGHSLHLSKSDQLVGRFNAHLRTALLVFADEAFFAGDKKNQGSLKALITEGVVAIEPKGVDLVMGKNRTHIIMATNSDWAVPASAEERRFFVTDVSSAKRGDFKYFEELNAELDTGGLAAMLHNLLNYDLSGFNVRDIPQTGALLDQKLLSLSGVDAWLYDCLQNGAVPSDKHNGVEVEWGDEGAVIPMAKAYDVFAGNAARYKCARDIPIKDVWSKRIRAVVSAGDTKSGGYRSLRLGPLSEARGKFARHIGHDVPWTEIPASTGSLSLVVPELEKKTDDAA